MRWWIGCLALAGCTALNAPPVVQSARLSADTLTLSLSDGTVWALKEMRSQPDAPATEVEENRRLFMQEARLLASLSYPNLPVVAELFENQGHLTMARDAETRVKGG